MSIHPVPDLGELTWHEARALLVPTTVALLPVGAIEAHGPHLPLNTDVMIARETARRAAALLIERGDSAVLLPPLTYGVSEVGTCFPGTAPVPAASISLAVERILVSIAGYGPNRLAVVNAHLEPAHMAAVEEAVVRARAATDAVIVFPDQRGERWSASLSEEFRQGARHTGSYETSLILATDPDFVRRGILPDLEPVWVDLPERLRAGAKSFAEAGGVDGYFGDPAKASAAEGQRLFRALATMVVTTIDEAVAATRDD